MGIMTEEILRKLLLQLDCDKYPSTFDTITAYEAGVDHVLSYGEVTPQDVQGLLHGVMFTRPRADLRQTAIFIGGRRVDACEEILQAAKNAMFDPYCLSVMLDSNGCNTASAAAVALIERTISLAGAKVVILSGFGPVGLRAAKLLAGDGARVLVTSLPREIFAATWNEERARHDTNLARQLGAEAGFEIQAVDTLDEMLSTLRDAQAVLATGPAGVQLLCQSDWAYHPSLKVLADLNVAPPYGIEGVNPHWHGHEENGRVFFGGLGIGHLKMKVHKAAVMSLFDADVILDTEEIYALAKTL
ncbi:MAG: methylenetetrahydromethanopterin dehydrogenase [Anaerolineales bacterium]|jgi:hypothetical protein